MKNGSGEPFVDMDGELKALLGIQIAGLEVRIAPVIAAALLQSPMTAEPCVANAP
jgi:hypothetical protein